MMTKYFKFFYLSLLSCSICSSLVYSQGNPCQQISSYKIVVLGSSTAAGTGPSVSDSTWVNRYRTYLESINPNNEVINLAVGGYNTYRIMPTGFVPPSSRPSPDINKNITAALAASPDAIIVNMPSNDVAGGFSYAEQMFNIDTIVQIANANSVPIWICTTQPRNFSNPNSLQLQSDLKDSISSIYGPFSIDFWSTIANVNYTINGAYNSGDGVHLNDAGHAILAQRVIDVDILSTIYSPPSQVDYGLQSLLIDLNSECGDSNTVSNIVIANYGNVDTLSSKLYLIIENTITNQSIVDSISFQSIASCETDTFLFSLNTYEMGEYLITSYIVANNDTNLNNDTVYTIINTLGHPQKTLLVDTLCEPGNGQLTANISQSDALFWYENVYDTIPIYNGANFIIPHIDSTTTWYIETVRGDLFYRSNLETTTHSNINWNGAMFNVIPQEDIVLDSIGLKVHTTGAQSIDVYYKQGSYLGSENNANDWTLMTTVSILITDSLSLSYYPLPAFSLSANDTIGIYVQMSNPQARLSYQSVPNPIVRSNSELTIITGTGISHNFVGNYFPRDLNCDIKYHFGNRPEGACSTGKIPATIYVSDFEFTIGNDTIIDLDDSLLLAVPDGLFNWFWDSGSTDSLITLRGSDLGSGIHYITLSGYDSLGCLKTDERILGVAQLVGLETYLNKSRYIFPNPSQDYVFSNFEGVYTVDIFDQEGRKIKTNLQFPIDVRTIPSGMYHLIVTDVHQATYRFQMVKR